MPLIHILDEPTINQIAAGEVVERPSAVIKELIENAMDAGATAVTAEIKDGGLSFIRITDNGSGIAGEDISLAFLRHATSKIKTAEDLLSITSLGFRGEALSSIAAVSQLELITKTPAALNGYRYLIEGGEEKSLEEIGCPGGTTLIVRNLFYNTPARRKFLKSAMTETGYISDLMARLMVSHPEVAFKYIVNNQVKLQSSGNHNSKDILYNVYGRDIARELLPVAFQSEELKITGFIGKPALTRGNRNYENYFINGRYIRSDIITKAVEEAYKPFLMQHKYPFTSLYFEIAPSCIDVNVHPQKMEIRLKNGEEVYQITCQAIRNTLSGKEMIPRVVLTPREEEKKKELHIPEPFEANRRRQLEGMVAESNHHYAAKTNEAKPNVCAGQTDALTEDAARMNAVKEYALTEDKARKKAVEESAVRKSAGKEIIITDNIDIVNADKDSIGIGSPNKVNIVKESIAFNNSNIKAQLADSSEAEPDRVEEPQIMAGRQLDIFENSNTKENSPFLSKKALEDHRIIGQIFSTYWLVEYHKELYIIDQHAAHEKVLYEKLMKAARNKTYVSQQLLPPIVLTLTLREQEVIRKNEEILNSLGYEFENFGGNEFSVRAVPADLYGISEKDLLLEFIDDMAEDFAGNSSDPALILERVASMSCKAAVKANHILSKEEAQALIRELLTLENPYHCPHGRPVIISMSQYELERKFKRII